jgi:hypothetical protein
VLARIASVIGMLGGGSVLLAVRLLGQSPAGAIIGAVADPDGGPVPTASVQARNVSTGTVYKAISGQDGGYTLSRLPGGTYDITIPPIGFTFPKFEQKAIVVQAGQRVHLDIHLVWGGNLGTPGDDVSIGIRSKGSPKGAAPRTGEGKPDLSGVWLGNAPEVEQATLLPWAEAIFSERRARAGAGNPSNSCLPGDIFLVSPFIYKIIQTPAVMAILWEGNPPGVLQIFLDGRRHPKNPFPTWMGHSVGRWEGDTLVVDTVGFNDLSWARLYPHTEKLHVVQRYHRPDLGHLDKDVTVEDTGTFAKPWKIHDTWDLAPTEEVQEYVCNENEKDAVHLPSR